MPRPAVRTPFASRPTVVLQKLATCLLLVLASALSGCSSTQTPLQPEEQDTVWSSGDIGTVLVQGETVLDSFGIPSLLKGSGADIWSTADSFHYSSQVVSGDIAITVRVDHIDAVHAWSKVGIMIRESLAPGSRNVFLHITEDNGAVLQARYQSSGSTIDRREDLSPMHHGPARAPWWLRLERSGDTITGWHSEDGVHWQDIEGLRLELPDQVFIGLGVTSHHNGQVATGRFSNVSVERAPTSEPGPEPEPEPAPEPQPTPPPQPGPTVTVRYTADDTTDFPNPERGWYSSNANHANGRTLVMRYIRLDDYRDQALPDTFLDKLRDDLHALRNRGVKLIVRFSYNHGMADDAPLSRVLQHIDQVTPILQEYGDVVAVLQAGFIGAWGEWHASTNGLLTRENRSAISRALLEALPEERMIQVRTPALRSDLFDQPTAATAFDNSPDSRVGHHNDCFLSSSNDTGTYRNQQDRDYVHHLSRYTAMGGEACQVGQLNERNDCLNELALYHWDYLNREFYTPIIDKWRDQGCYDEISRRLGYRYDLVEATSATHVQAGQTLALDLTIRNQGWGKLYNPRPLRLILQPTGGGTPVVLTAHQDARRVLPLAGQTATIPIRVQVPADTASGSYQLHLDLPDPSPRLGADPRYAIRFANHGTWDPDTGLNDLMVTVEVP